MNLWWSKLLVVFVAVWLLLRFGPSIPVSSVVSQKQDFFTVTGEGKVTVVPDTAIVDLGITINQPSVKVAQSEANSVINSISQAIKNLGVAAKDIKTSNYSVYPLYDQNRITSYQVNTNLTITVREIDKVNQVIDTATSKGANSVGGIQLTVDENKKKQLLQDARELAVKEAKSKAESLARAAGLTLGKIVNVQESFGSVPVPMYAKSAIGLGGGREDTQIQPGSTDISTSVTLFYETR